MLPSKLAFVDIETTGLRAFHDRVIEIAILRVEDNKITRSFTSLIDPQTHLPQEITRMTGITTQELENAPTFRQIKDDVLDILLGCTFVAHNVRFDYSFIRNEFKRHNLTYSSKHFCTVRLSHALYPRFRRHNLDSLIERFGFKCSNRHRAYDDARVLVDFYNKIIADFSPEQIEKAIDMAIKKPSIPLRLKTDLSALPENPGVYIFYGNQGTPLYVGKSKNLRERILSHFSADLRSPVDMKISQQIVSIETIETAGELGALILESDLIKKMLPLYNQKSRLKRELVVLRKKTNKDGYETIKMETITNPFQNTQLPKHSEYSVNQKSSDKSENQIGQISDYPEKTELLTHRHAEFSESSELPNFPSLPDFDSILGFFKSRKQAKKILAEVAMKHLLCDKLLGLESGNSQKKSSCFAYRLGRCKGACVGREKSLMYNLRFTLAFSLTKIKQWPFRGPIIIEEAGQNKKEYLIINQWLYLGSIRTDEDRNEDKKITESPTFDLDIYKILQNYLSRPENYKKVSLLKSSELFLPQI